MQVFVSESKLPKFKKPRKQSAVVPYMVDEKGNIQIVLIKSKHGGNWGLPKGAIEKHLTKKASAELEALEEAGLKGKVGDKLGTYEYVKGLTGRKQHVTVYPMEVTKMKKKYLEAEWRIRKVFDGHKAAGKVNKKQKPFLLQLIKDISRSRL